VRGHDEADHDFDFAAPPSTPGATQALTPLPAWRIRSPILNYGPDKPRLVNAPNDALGRSMPWPSEKDERNFQLSGYSQEGLR
jgi:hypothetical protein